MAPANIRKNGEVTTGILAQMQGHIGLEKGFERLLAASSRHSLCSDRVLSRLHNCHCSPREAVSVRASRKTLPFG
jgi:hypothetical protein